MAALAALGVYTDRDTVLAADFSHLVDEFLARHGSYVRSQVSEVSSGIPDSGIPDGAIHSEGVAGPRDCRVSIGVVGARLACRNERSSPPSPATARSRDGPSTKRPCSGPRPPTRRRPPSRSAPPTSDPTPPLIGHRVHRHGQGQDDPSVIDDPVRTPGLSNTKVSSQAPAASDADLTGAHELL